MISLTDLFSSWAWSLSWLLILFFFFFGWLFELLTVNEVFTLCLGRKNIRNKLFYLLLVGSHLPLYLLNRLYMPGYTFLSFVISATAVYMVCVLLFKGGQPQKIFYVAMLLSMSFCIETIVIRFIEFFPAVRLDTLIDENAVSYYIVFLTNAITMIFQKITIRFVAEKNNNVKSGSFYLFLILPVSSIILFGLLKNARMELRRFDTALLLFSAVGLMFSNQFVFYLYEKIYESFQAMQDKALNDQKAEYDNKIYEALERKQEELKIYIHDFNKHLNYVSRMAVSGSGELEDYLKSMEIKPSFPINRIKTGCESLDIIINEKMYECERLGVVFTAHIEKNSLHSMDKPDMNSIIGNILDNAVESCAISAEKNIYMKIYSSSDYINFIHLINSCDIKPRIENGNLISSKKNKEYHGYGIKSVKRTLHKYNGNIITEYNGDKKQFITNIMISV